MGWAGTVARLGAIGIPLLLSGCANFSDRAYTPANPESRALQIAKAAALAGLQDNVVPREPNSAGGGSVVQPIAGGVAGAISPAPGFTGVSGGVLGALAALGEPGPNRDSTFNHILAWAPLSEASTAEEARALVDRLVTAALRDALLEVLGASYAVTEDRLTVAQFRGRYRPLPVDRDSPYDFTWFAVAGGLCADSHVCGYSAHIRTLPRKGFAPAIIGGGPAWTFTRYAGLPTLSTSCWNVGRPLRAQLSHCLPDLKVYLALSRRLPEWAFLYLAPGTTAVEGETLGTFGPLVAPVVLAQGEELHFTHQTIRQSGE